MTIAITGATGQLGRLVIASLLKKKVPAAQIVAIARDPDKAKALAAQGVQVRKADYNHAEGWDAAFRGVDKLLLISASDFDMDLCVRQHETVIHAAKRAGVKLIAYTSLLHADSTLLGLGQKHRASEAAIHDAGIPYVILRNSWYTENYAMGIPNALAQGAVYGAAGEGKISSAPRADYAEAAAVVLTSEGHANKTYELAGDHPYTLTQFAAEVAHQSGKDVKYVNLPEAEYKKALVAAGLPEPIAEMLADSDAGVAKGALHAHEHHLSQLIGHPTTPLADVVKEALKKAS